MERPAVLCGNPPAVLRKFEATFDAYWSERSFETYDPPDTDGQRLDEALAQAGAPFDRRGGSNVITLSGGLEVRPYPHQRDMLERLEVERAVHERHRNLLVAATGTGKTVMAALDYKHLRQKHGRDLRLLFVAHRKEILEQSLRVYQNVLVDANFGEPCHSGDVPADWTHVFASAQSLKSQTLDRLAPDHFDVIVIDEFHHGTSDTYRRIVKHFAPPWNFSDSPPLPNGWTARAFRMSTSMAGSQLKCGSGKLLRTNC